MKHPPMPPGYKATGANCLTAEGAAALGRQIEAAWRKVGIILTPRKVTSVGKPMGEGKFTVHTVDMSDFINGMPLPHAIRERRA